MNGQPAVSLFRARTGCCLLMDIALRSLAMLNPVRLGQPVWTTATPRPKPAEQPSPQFAEPLESCHPACVSPVAALSPMNLPSVNVCGALSLHLSLGVSKRWNFHIRPKSTGSPSQDAKPASSRTPTTAVSCIRYGHSIHQRHAVIALGHR